MKIAYKQIDGCVISVYNVLRGGTLNIEKIPRHKEVNESLTRMILRKWKLL